MQIKRITTADDLEGLVVLINNACWDSGNDMADYRAEDLVLFLSDDNNLLVAAFVGERAAELGGIASARVALKPYDQCRWLYIDEVDTCANLRRRGIGRALMNRLLTFARESGCQEVWLGTEPDNEAANGLYRSLQPESVDLFVGYTFDPRAGNRP